MIERNGRIGRRRREKRREGDEDDREMEEWNAEIERERWRKG